MSKNHYFERDLERQITKAKRNLEICMLYVSLHDVTEVARRMNISTKTVRKVIDSDSLVPTTRGMHYQTPIKEIPKRI